MQIRITGRHLEITPAIREYTEKKISSLSKYLDHIMEAHVILKIEKNLQCCEIKMPAGGLFLYGEEKGNDLYVSIDKAVARMERQLKKIKAKIKSKNHKDIQHIRSGGIIMDDEPSDESDEPRLVRVDRFADKPMSVKEGMIQLDSSHDDFIVFTNSEDNQVNVVYRRFDGSYGLIAKN